MSSEDVAFLISADLFACGLANSCKVVGFLGWGIGLQTFAFSWHDVSIAAPQPARISHAIV
jgi:xanthine/uracil permease